jgi:GDP-4-dehydro-6-deoxy-D-mannose reductase
MPSRVLITGITGFSGSHLAERLVAGGDIVHGFAFEEPPYRNLAAIADKVRMYRGDITRVEDLRAAIAAASPDVLVHLAGQAIPTEAARDPVAAVRVNVLGSAAVIASVDERPGTALVIASSADVYGATDRSLVNEDAPVHPANTYAATKVAVEALARELGDRRQRAVVILRPTNQIGPRQHPGLAASAFAKQIAEAEVKQREPIIKHGSLEAKRDFLDVRDMAEAYARAMTIRAPGTHLFNVGTGRAVAIDEILNGLLSLARIPVRAELDPERVRTGVPLSLALDSTRFRTATGWAPRIDLRTSLRDLLDYWRVQVRQEARV